MYIVSRGFCFCFSLLMAHIALASGIDSVRTIVTPVQCFGLRNGVIQVDSVFGGEKPYFYSIDGQSFTTNPIFDRLWAGEYTLYVRDASGGTKRLPIQIKEPTNLQIKLVVSSPTVLAGEPLAIRAISSVEREFLDEISWTPSELFPRQDTLRQFIFVIQPTLFSVLVRDFNGCTAHDSVMVSVEEPKLYFPNIINPGSASDAYFTVFSGEGVRRVVSLQVYSRGGGMVFERMDFLPNVPNLGWGGLWNGKVAQAGVYPYLAVVEFWDGKQRRFEGNVTVVN